MNFCSLLLLPFLLADAVVVKTPKKGQQKYIVYPGLDVDNTVIAGWMNGYSSPWNVFFGNQPYIVGWVGEEEEGYDYADEDYEAEEYSSNYGSSNSGVAIDAPHDEVTQDRG